ncbi:hypothetical protein DL98DRAFT_181389 [Cadophora sp. DSE1049]|nr:hypothetical protein DL98DRAFT_181389 [Cadophora sp. DSE1049]
MDSSDSINGDSVAENSKVPNREHVSEEKSPGELIQATCTMVTIYVGPAKVKWVLPEALLSNDSSFFKTAFQGSFSEGSSKAMYLEEDDPRIFKIFVDYLYNWRKWRTMETTSEIHEHMMTHFALEVFADKIGSSKLSFYAEDNYYYGMQVSEYTYRPTRTEVKFVFENCPEDSEFRSILVHRTMINYLSSDVEGFGYWGSLMASNATFV